MAHLVAKAVGGGETGLRLGQLFEERSWDCRVVEEKGTDRPVNTNSRM